MAIRSRKYSRIKDKSKTYPKIDAKKLAEALGAELITNLEEKKEFERKYHFPFLFIPMPKYRKSTA